MSRVMLSGVLGFSTFTLFCPVIVEFFWSCCHHGLHALQVSKDCIVFLTVIKHILKKKIYDKMTTLARNWCPLAIVLIKLCRKSVQLFSIKRSKLGNNKVSFIIRIRYKMKQRCNKGITNFIKNGY